MSDIGDIGGGAVASTLQMLPCAVFTVDAQQRITFWNREAEQITGYAADEVLGQPCTVFAQEPCHQGCALLDQNRENAPVMGKECQIRHKDGRILTISKNADLLRDASGSVVGGVESFFDITTAKHSEVRFRELFENMRSAPCLAQWRGHWPPASSLVSGPGSPERWRGNSPTQRWYRPIFLCAVSCPWAQLTAFGALKSTGRDLAAGWRYHPHGWRRRWIVKKVLVVVLVLVLLGGAAGLWWHLGRVGRSLDSVAEGVGFDYAMGEELVRHAKDDRVWPAFRKWLSKVSQPGYQPPYEEQGSSLTNILEAMKQVCQANPPKLDDAAVRELALASTGFVSREAANACLPGFDSDPRVEAVYMDIMLNRIGKATSRAPGDEVVLKEILRRNPPTTQALIDAMVHAAAANTYKPAKEYLAGLGADPRLTASYEKFLIATSKERYPKGLSFLKKEYERLPPAPRPELADAVAKIYVKFCPPGTAVATDKYVRWTLKATVDLARVLPGAGERVRQLAAQAKPGREQQSLKKLAAAIAPREDEVALLLRRLPMAPQLKGPAINFPFQPGPEHQQVLDTLTNMRPTAARTIHAAYLGPWTGGGPCQRPGAGQARRGASGSGGDPSAAGLRPLRAPVDQGLR
jgi:PAS domain S-box-containing protein